MTSYIESDIPEKSPKIAKRREKPFVISMFGIYASNDLYNDAVALGKCDIQRKTREHWRGAGAAQSAVESEGIAFRYASLGKVDELFRFDYKRKKLSTRMYEQADKAFAIALAWRIAISECENWQSIKVDCTLYDLVEGWKAYIQTFGEEDFLDDEKRARMMLIIGIIRDQMPTYEEFKRTILLRETYEKLNQSVPGLRLYSTSCGIGTDAEFVEPSRNFVLALRQQCALDLETIFRSRIDDARAWSTTGNDACGGFQRTALNEMMLPAFLSRMDLEDIEWIAYLVRGSRYAWVDAMNTHKGFHIEDVEEYNGTMALARSLSVDIMMESYAKGVPLADVLTDSKYALDDWMISSY